MHQEYVYVLTLIRAFSHIRAFVPGEESLGCFQTLDIRTCSLTRSLLHGLSAGKMKQKEHN